MVAEIEGDYELPGSQKVTSKIHAGISLDRGTGIPDCAS